MTINIDEDQINADWIRARTWDLPTDVDEFLHVVGGPEGLAHFMTLPAALPMPETLRAELIARLGGNDAGSGRPARAPRA